MDDSLGYSLTLKNIKAALSSLSENGTPLFMLKRKPPQDELETLGIKDYIAISECPVIENENYYSFLETYFSRDFSATHHRKFNQRNMLFFLFGGYRRFANITDEKLSYIFNGKNRAQSDVELFAEDLLRWKGILLDDGQWHVVNSEKNSLQGETISLFQYIVKMNDILIHEFCSSTSLEGFRDLLRSFSKEICSAEQSGLEDSIAPMNQEHVEMLSTLLDLLYGLAVVNTDDEQSIYLAEGLTWLMTASILRSKLSCIRDEMIQSLQNAHRSAARIGIIKTETLDDSHKMIPTNQDLGLYDRIMERFHYSKSQHPSIRMIDPDPSLIPEGLPGIKSSERVGTIDNKEPRSIKQMVLDSWREPIHKHKHILLIGEGGIGKTVAILTLPDEEWLVKFHIPFLYIPLQDLDIYEGNLNDYIRNSYGSDAEKIVDLANTPWKNHPELLLLLDGFNEIPDQFKATAERYIREWMDRPGVQVIATSRISFMLTGRFVEYKLEPLPIKTVRNALLLLDINEEELPEKKDPIWDVIRIPLMLTLYTRTERFRDISEDEWNLSDLLDWKPSNNAACIIWNYLETEICHCIKTAEDNSARIMSASAILALAPFICFEMLKNNEFYLDKKTFFNYIKLACGFYEKHPEIIFPQVQRIKDVFDDYDDIRIADESDWKKYAKILTNQIALFQKQVSFRKTSVQNSIIEEAIYVPVHQNFRDALAAFFVISCLQGFKRIQEKQTQSWDLFQYMDYYIKKNIAELLTDKELEEIWEYHRKVDPENGTITWILMDLIGLKRNYDYREMDFSGLDLTKTSLHRLLSRRNDICTLPTIKGRFSGTKISKDTLLPRMCSTTITGLSFCRDGTTLASVSQEGVIHIFDLEKGQDQVLTVDNEEILGISFSPRDNSLASCSSSGAIRIWDIFNGYSWVLGKHSGVQVISYAPGGHQLASASKDGTINIWEIDRRSIRVLGKYSGVRCISFSPNGEMLACGSTDGIIRIFDTNTGNSKILGEDFGIVTRLEFEPRKNHLFSCSTNGTIRIFDLNNGSIHILDQILYFLECLALSPDGKYLACESLNEIHVYDLESGKSSILGRDNGVITCLEFAPRKNCLVSGSTDGTIRVFDFDTGQQQTLTHFPRTISSMAYDPKRACLACGLYDSTIRIWDVETGDNHVLGSFDGDITCLVYDPGSDSLVSGDITGTIHIWDVNNGDSKILRAHPELICIAFDLSQDLLISGSTDDSLQIWNTNSGESRILGKHQGLTCIAYIPEKKYLISCSRNGTIYKWDLENSQEQTYDAYDNKEPVTCIAVDHVGDRIIISSCQRTNEVPVVTQETYENIEWSSSISIWSFESGQSRVLGCVSELITCIEYDPGQDILFSGSQDGTLRIWEMESGDNRVLGKHPGLDFITCDLMRDYLISASYDGSIHISNVEKPSKIKRFRNIPGIIISGANLEAAIMTEEDREFFRQAGAKVRN